MTVININEVRLINEGDEYGPSSGSPYQADIHLIRNGLFLDLYPKIILQVNTNDGGTTYVRPTDPDFPSNISIAVTTNIKAAAIPTVGLEISNSATSWKVKALAQPAQVDDNYTKLKSFIITVTASLPSNPPIEIKVRAFVHAELTSWWVSPTSLTLRPIASTDMFYYRPKFTIYGNFNGIIADISELNGVLTEPREITVGSTTRTVVDVSTSYGNVLVPQSDISFTLFPGTEYANAVKITLPTHLGGASKNASVKYTNWANEPSGKTQIYLSGAGPGYAQRNNVANLLIISDGFDNEDEFRRYVDAILVDMSDKNHLSPYNLLIPHINVFTLFLSTSATGSSIGSPYFVENYLTAPNEGDAYFLTSFLATLEIYQGSQPTEVQNIRKLLKYLGYAPLDLQSSLTSTSSVNGYWNFLNSNYSSLEFTESEFKNAAQNWAKLKMILFNESDSQIGVITGDKPSLNLEHSGEYRYQNINYRRMSRQAMSDLLNNLYFDTGSALEPMGTMFSDGGKDQANVILLCKNPSYGAVNNSYGDMHTLLVNIGTSNYRTFRTKKQSEGYSIVSPPAPTTSAGFHNDNYAYMHTIAHELAHSYDVKDEYSEGLEANLTANSYMTDANNVSYKTLNDNSSGQNKINVSKLKWNRPVYAGVAKAKVKSKSDSLVMEVIDGEADLFKGNDKLQVTNLPLKQVMASLESSKFTNELTVDSVEANDIHCSLPSSGLTDLNVDEEYYLLKLGLGFNGEVLRFTAPATTSIMEAENGSLTMVTTGPLVDFLDITAHDISNDTEGIQTPKFLPTNFNQKVTFPDAKKPYRLKSKMNDSNIVGLYVGGDRLTKGVYHPTGKCMMRTELDGQAALPLCPICSYQIILCLDYKRIREYYDYFIPVHYIKHLNLLNP